jgi:type II secretory ATPase GspE/PulE/Tfp pilus assembly ATPase PilB-like protein
LRTLQPKWLSRPCRHLLGDEDERADEAEIGNVAREEGMLTLREDGLAKVRAGQTSLEEVLRVTA